MPAPRTHIDTARLLNGAGWLTLLSEERMRLKQDVDELDIPDFPRPAGTDYLHAQIRASEDLRRLEREQEVGPRMLRSTLIMAAVVAALVYIAFGG